MIGELKPYLIGWRGYFGFCQTPRVLTNLEAWIRRRLRSYLLAAVAERAQSLQRTAPAWRTEVQCSGRRRFTDGVLAHVRTPGGPTGPAQSLLRLTRSSPTPRLRPSLTQSNRRGTDPYVRWWGRGGIARCPPIPIIGADLPLLLRPTNGQDCPFRIPSANTTIGIPVLKLEGGQTGQLKLNQAARGLSRRALSGQPAPTRASRKPAQCNQSSRDGVPLRGPCRVAGE